MVEVNKISFEETKRFSKIALDYLNQDEKLQQFFEYETNLDSFEKVIEDRKNVDVDRGLLVSVLKSKYKELNIAEPKSLESLKEKNTFTVTTGHQLGIFTGPSYFIYKIASVINLCNSLKEEYPKNNYIPVFWMASEDHDYEEIRSTKIYGKKVDWNTNQKGAVGRFYLEEFKETLESVKEILGDRNEEFYKKLEGIYCSENLSNATFRLVSEIFKDENLVIIDADNSDLKRLFIPVLKQDILENIAYKEVMKTNETLAANYKTQVTPRPINVFYLKNGLRERIIDKNGVFEIKNTNISFSQKEILEELSANPERFSPNVVLRPMFQETILPNLCYVGGGGELAYWLQLKSAFKAKNVFLPMLLIRSSVMWIDKSSNKKIEKLKLSINELFEHKDDLIKKWVNRSSTSELSLTEFENKLTDFYNLLEQKVKVVDKSILGQIKAEQSKSNKFISGLEKRLVKSEKQKLENEVNQLTKLLEKFFPNGGLQERSENFMSFYFNNENWVNILVKELNPLDRKFVVFTEK